VVSSPGLDVLKVSSVEIGPADNASTGEQKSYRLSKHAQEYMNTCHTVQGGVSYIPGRTTDYVTDLPLPN
jgi:hypothetical protein